MRKTPAQIYAERRQRIEERREFLIENLEVYQRDFDETFKNYLMRKYPEDLDPEDCDNKFHPLFRENFPESPEGLELAIKYSLNRAWDPDGDDPPSPSNFSSVRVIRRQDDRIWRNQIQKDSIINLPPYKYFGRFLIVEIDLSYPRREINTDIMAWVDQELKELKITELETGSHHELVERSEPRNRDISFKYKKMEVWKKVEKKRGIFNEPENEILSQLAKELCESEGWDESYGKFGDDPDTEERVKIKCKALKNAYERDKELYYGEDIFRGVSK
jgi:hypothetical protein